MAEIAAIFHWPLSELANMDLDELGAWHTRAISCFKRMQPRE
ncbi:MAG: GpE family phage tail protein [Candidatus Oceanisphaera merdipullorum]|nr:GpE family phage tail protein [Candidatus Oceanisphaera merdipullorum]